MPVEKRGDAHAIVCTRGKTTPCDTPNCDRVSRYLCDYPLSGALRGKTCDRAMCETHRTNVGKERDYCPAHAKVTA